VESVKELECSGIPFLSKPNGFFKGAVVGTRRLFFPPAVLAYVRQRLCFRLRSRGEA
jgi:hypothetical protein